MKVAGLLPTKALVCLLFATFVFSILQDRPVCAQDSPGDQGLLLEMARAGLEAGQYKQAARLCEGILQKDSVNKEANFLLGIAQHYLGEHDLAVERLQWVLLVDKNNTVAREYLEKSKTRNISQWPPWENTQVETAVQFDAEGLNGLAIGTLKKVLKQNPKNTRALEALGDVYRKLGNPTIAKAAYHKANAEEKAREIKGEAEYILKEWWEGLDKIEDKLYKADQEYYKVRGQMATMERKLTEIDTRIGGELTYKEWRIREKLNRAVVTERKAEIESDKEVKYPMLDDEIDEKVAEKLSIDMEKYLEERSNTKKMLEVKSREVDEAKSLRESLEEELIKYPFAVN